jgi:hypothetical protein
MENLLELVYPNGLNKLRSEENRKSDGCFSCPIFHQFMPANGQVLLFFIPLVKCPLKASFYFLVYFLSRIKPLMGFLLTEDGNGHIDGVYLNREEPTRSLHVMTITPIFLIIWKYR